MDDLQINFAEHRKNDMVINMTGKEFFVFLRSFVEKNSDEDS